MEIKKFTTGGTQINAPDADAVSETTLEASVTDNDMLVLRYIKPTDNGDEHATFTFNRYETQKIRTVLRHTEG